MIYRMRLNHFGFTLIELSIVLVIVALLVAGILVGSSLIEVSRLHKVGVEAERYITATNAFRERYGCLPGDCAQASRFNLGTNGNGNGMIDYPYGGNLETYYFWQHMAAAGFAEGSFSGTATFTCIGTNPCNIPGTNVPSTALGGTSMIAPVYFNNATIGYNGNTLSISDTQGLYPGVWHNALFTPREQYLIDAKFDDGKPYTGKILDLLGNQPYWTQGCATSETDVSAEYVKSATTKLCLIMWRLL